MPLLIGVVTLRIVGGAPELVAGGNRTSEPVNWSVSGEVANNTTSLPRPS